MVSYTASISNVWFIIPIYEWYVLQIEDFCTLPWLLVLFWSLFLINNKPILYIYIYIYIIYIYSICLYFIIIHLIIKEAKYIKMTFFTFRHTVFYEKWTLLPLIYLVWFCHILFHHFFMRFYVHNESNKVVEVKAGLI